MSEENKPIAIVLAAGKGTRMKSDLPKVLCQANGRPLVSYVIDSLRAAGVGRIIVVVGYRAEMVRAALSEVQDIQFAEQNEQLGTGHAVMVCRDVIKDFHGPVVVVAGDSPMLQAESIRQLIEVYRQSQATCLLGTLIHDDPTGLGRIVRNDAGNFLGIVEHKDCSEAQLAIREVNMSTYLIECQKMLDALEQVTSNNTQNEYYITDVPGILLKNGHDVRALPVLNPIEALSVNTVDQLQRVEQEMQRLASLN